jgi:hypothetical protein
MDGFVAIPFDAEIGEILDSEPVQETHKLPEGEATTAENAEVRGGDEKKEITSEPVAPQGVEGDDEPEKAAEEITSKSADMAVGLAGPACTDDDPAANTKPASNSHQQPTPSPVADKAEAVSSHSVSAPIPDEFDPSKLWLNQDKPRKTLRPNCLHPELCRSGFPREHCHTCKKAMAESEAA